MGQLNFTTIQTPLHWEDKAANLAMLEKKIALAPAGGIVVLPEMFSTGFSMSTTLLAETMQGPTVSWMRGLAASKKIVLTGSLMIEEDGKYYNRLIWMLPNGQHGHYDKRHLFAFAGEHLHYTAGHKKLVAQINGWKINLLVCYDLRFPVWARQPPGDEKQMYDLLVVVANWPERRRHAWRTLLQARAIENQCYVVAVNRIGADGKGIMHSGDSLVIDPLGAVIYDADNREEVVTTALDRAVIGDVRGKFPFWKDRDGFELPVGG